MRVLQISKTLGPDCGIALFARSLQTHLRAGGIEVDTADCPSLSKKHDLLLVQHHVELFTDNEVASLAAGTDAPVVLFAHSECSAGAFQYLDGFVFMCPGMIVSTHKPVHTFLHPAWTPQSLEDRATLRHEFGLPEKRLIVGSNGFLKFERQFVEIVEVLLPEARRSGWFLELITSPWRIDSPGELSRLEGLCMREQRHFRFHHGYLDAATLNRRLQACDVLWCWTGAPSAPCASGAISDQYASGTRVLAADKQQHRHVLGLPNTVAAPDALVPFLDCLLEELRMCPRQRHDPSPVSWGNCISGLIAFLCRVANGWNGPSIGLRQ
jgi:hypothetical protein